jgi:spoIIIJ-associated protein
MEWVETTGRTIDEAKDRALDQLGVDEEDAEFEIVEEPRPGLFGRVRGEARVRARVRPTQPRPKADRRRKRTPRDAGETQEATVALDDRPTDDEIPPEPTRATRPPRRREEAAPAAEAEAAARFLEGLAAAFGLEATTEIVPDPEETEIRLQGADLGLLIGPRGQTIMAVQDLTRLAVSQALGERQGRLRVDIGGYREKRNEALVRFVHQVVEQVKATGAAKALEPMSPPDRKVVHDTVNQLDGVTTVSEGEEPHRRVVIRPDA